MFPNYGFIEEDEIEEAAAYNVTACCVEANLNSVCLPLCSYNANMNDIKRLANSTRFFVAPLEEETTEAAAAEGASLQHAYRSAQEYWWILYVTLRSIA
ncbi:hypothetical protein YQE_12781, partial [Dendroctonus ponderosae]